MAGNSNLVDIQLYVHDTRDRSVMVSESGLSKDVFFLPLSQIEVAQIEETGRSRIKDNRIKEITMPEWLAVEKGLV